MLGGTIDGPTRQVTSYQVRLGVGGPRRLKPQFKTSVAARVLAPACPREKLREVSDSCNGHTIKGYKAKATFDDPEPVIGAPFAKCADFSTRLDLNGPKRGVSIAPSNGSVCQSTATSMLAIDPHPKISCLAK